MLVLVFLPFGILLFSHSRSQEDVVILVVSRTILKLVRSMCNEGPLTSDDKARQVTRIRENRWMRESAKARFPFDQFSLLYFDFCSRAMFHSMPM